MAPSEIQSASHSATVSPRLHRASPRFGLALVAILLLALFGRLWNLGSEDYWLDELHSLLNSAGRRAEFEALPVGQIIRAVPDCTTLDGSFAPGRVWRGMRDDSHPPLYFVLLHMWRVLFGDGELATRLPSALISVLSIVPVVWLCGLTGAPRAGLAVGALLALAQVHILMGQQARPYALSIALIAAAYALLALMDTRWGDMTRRGRAVATIAYGVSLLMAMLTHYFAALALCGHLPIVLARWRGSRLAVWLLTVTMSAGLFGLIWGPSMADQWAFISQQDWLLDPAPDHVRRTLLRAASLPLRHVVARPLPDWSGRQMEWEAMIGLAILAVPAMLLYRRPVRGMAWFAAWAGLPILILTVIDLATGKELLTHPRYGCVAAPGIAGWVVLGLGQRSRRVMAYAAAVGLALAALTLRLPAIRHPDARRAAAIVDELAGADDLVIYDAAGWIPYWPRRLAVLVEHYRQGHDGAILMLSEDAGSETRDRIERFPRVAVVSPRLDQPVNPAPRTHAEIARSEYVFDIGWIYLYARRNPP